ncbi:MAG: glycosyltransferase [Clostridia bacterium]|nr:glycosyltransferase [Clostridia bacterium]
MKRILFFSESLNGGGAEAALVRIVELLADKYDITVVSQTDGEKHTDYIKSLCTHKPFTKKADSGFLNNLIIKGFITLPPAVVCSTYLHGEYDIEVACCEGFSTKIIGASKRNSVKVAYIHTDFVNNPWSAGVYKGDEQEEKECYSKFDKIICVSETIRNAFVQKYGLAEKTEVIYNLIDDRKIKKMSLESATLKVNKRPAFVLVGNYLKVKGYDRLMNVAHRLKNEGYDFSFTIMGRPEEKHKIQKLCDDFELNDYVNLMGFEENPYKYMKQADCYVCSSYAEGYSTAVCEAVICGLPVITTDCSGMREIFGQSEIGLICENSEDGLYGAIKSVLDNPELLHKYKQNAPLRAEDLSYVSRARAVEDFYKTL